MYMKGDKREGGLLMMGMGECKVASEKWICMKGCGVEMEKVAEDS